jgi:hypothetical protein
MPTTGLNSQNACSHRSVNGAADRLPARPGALPIRARDCLAPPWDCLGPAWGLHGAAWGHCGKLKNLQICQILSDPSQNLYIDIVWPRRLFFFRGQFHMGRKGTVHKRQHTSFCLSTPFGGTSAVLQVFVIVLKIYEIRHKSTSGTEVALATSIQANNSNPVFWGSIKMIPVKHDYVPWGTEETACKRSKQLQVRQRINYVQTYTNASKHLPNDNGSPLAMHEDRKSLIKMWNCFL